ncbi:MAG: hypothetical protein AAGH99_06505 [Planctomycetota bacterium]
MNEVTERMVAEPGRPVLRELQIAGMLMVPPSSPGVFAVQPDLQIESVTDATGYRFPMSEAKTPPQGSQASSVGAVWQALQMPHEASAGNRGHLPFSATIPLPGMTLSFPVQIKGRIKVLVPEAVETVQLPLDAPLTQPVLLPDGSRLLGFDVSPPNFKSVGFSSVSLEMESPAGRRIDLSERPISTLFGARLFLNDGSSYPLLPPRHSGNPASLMPDRPWAWSAQISGEVERSAFEPKYVELDFATVTHPEYAPIEIRLGRYASEAE